MGIFQRMRNVNINEGANIARNIPGAVLLDVRTEPEYRSGHIPGSKNIPLQQLDKVESVIENKEGALFVYCYSGARSSQAVSQLRRMGYTNVQNIGGIAAYHGKVDVL